MRTMEHMMEARAARRAGGTALRPAGRTSPRVLHGRYRVLGEVGGGGMSMVYRARDLRARRGEARIVALKELRTFDLAPGERDEVLAQFKKEAAILSALDHPNLPKVLDYFSTGLSHYLVMEFVEGRSLDDVLKDLKGSPMDEKTALVHGIQVCRVLHYLGLQRPRPIVFRDLKPSNIMVTPSGRVKLVDFGIARFLKEAKPQDTFVFGTPGYAAPEQYGSSQTDQRSDIFSLGATLHHCVTGQFPPSSPAGFRPIQELNPRVGRKTSRAIMAALSQDRDDRYQSPQEMKADLYDALLALDRHGRDSFITRTTRALTLTGPHRMLPVNAIRLGPLSLLRGRARPRSFEVPLAALGCSTLRGTIRFDCDWVSARPRNFSEGSGSVIVEVDPSALGPGRVYEAQALISTNAGVLRPILRFRTRPSVLPWAALFFLLAWGVTLFL